jgi:hypothetical protein
LGERSMVEAMPFRILPQPFFDLPGICNHKTNDIVGTANMETATKSRCPARKFQDRR